ncbi:hypothetical protein [Subtercola sp. RTI3]|uniref:hypothetical protein n=1 Tax=Subtercola sp. RTI3 TaxID=3048639 RepID=UPI002B22C3BB|nr:hypothetical protein [Subtercola sp. RTI3]MEA9986297.1 hypothetical protein [Subtercola sp. RTI3]
MADPKPGGDGLGPLIETINGIKSRLGMLEGFSGADYVKALQKIDDLVDGLPAQVDELVDARLATELANYYTSAQTDSKVALPGDIAPGKVNASGNITTGGSVTAAGAVSGGAVTGSSLTSTGTLDASGPVRLPNAYVTDITWTRVSGWIGNDGRVGYASSKRSKKFHIDNVTFDVVAFKLLQVVHFQYRAERAKQRAAPDYHVSVNVGMYADDLHAAGYWEYVIYQFDEDDLERANPVPGGIHYELLGLLAIQGVQYLIERLDAAGIQ